MILISDERSIFALEKISKVQKSDNGNSTIYHFQLNDGTTVTLSEDNLSTQIYKEFFTPREIDYLKQSGLRWKIVDKEDEI